LSEFLFVADLKQYRGTEPTRKLFVPKRFRWSFGDGHTEATTQPSVKHDFDDRPQDTMESSFLIACEAESADGEKLLGRTLVPLPNPAYESFARKKMVRLFFHFEPPFPELSASGIVKQRVRIWHARPDPVEITKVVMQRQGLSGRGRPSAEEVDVWQTLGNTTIPPGHGLDLDLTLDTKVDQVFGKTYFLEGKSQEGFRASGSMSLMRPPAPPTRDRHTPVNDPFLMAEIRTAERILGKDVVTHEELTRLRLEGRLTEAKRH
jgi:hypothetical protein